MLADDDVRAPLRGRLDPPLPRPRRAPSCGPADAAQVAAVLARLPRARRGGRAAGRQHRHGRRRRPARRRGASSAPRASTELGPVDRAPAQVEAGAGVTLAALQAHARAAGLDAGVDFGARDSATVGGLVATDAGGIARRAPRDGSRAGRRAAGGPRRRHDLDRRPRCSRTTPATTCRRCWSAARARSASSPRVRWRLVPRLPSRVAALIPLRVARPGRRAAARRCARGCPRCDAADFFLDEGLQLVLDHLGLAGARRRRARRSTCCSSARRRPTRPRAGRGRWRQAGIEDAVVADDSAERERAVALSRGARRGDLRRRHPAQARRRRPARAAGRVRRRACATEVRAPGPRGARDRSSATSATATSTSTCSASSPTTTRSTRRSCGSRPTCGGTISAEHGVGVAKARWLELARSPRRAARDGARSSARSTPTGLLNPGVVLP